MKRAALLTVIFVTTLIGLGVLRSRLGGEHAAASTDSREVLKVGFLPVT